MGAKIDRAKIWLTKHKQSLLLIKEIESDNKIDIEKIDKIIADINSLQMNYEKETFKNLFKHAIIFYNEISGFKENELHTLYNLALVDKDTNSQLNNSFFDIKRELLKENKLGKYVPICTQRAFSKYYSARPKEMIFWSNNDRNVYFNAIETVYNSFINLNTTSNGN